MLWETEFNEEYCVPKVILRLVQDEYAEDLSYRNDVSPCFGLVEQTSVDMRELRLWVEHPDEGSREFGIHASRYIVQYLHNSDTVEHVESHTADQAVSDYLEMGARYRITNTVSVAQRA